MGKWTWLCPYSQNPRLPWVYGFKSPFFSRLPLKYVKPFGFVTQPQPTWGMAVAVFIQATKSEEAFDGVVGSDVIGWRSKPQKINLADLAEKKSGGSFFWAIGCHRIVWVYIYIYTVYYLYLLSCTGIVNHFTIYSVITGYDPVTSRFHDPWSYQSLLRLGLMCWEWFQVVPKNNATKSTKMVVKGYRCLKYVWNWFPNISNRKGCS